MFRKMMMVAVPAMAFVLTLVVTDNSSSQAFAKGGRGGHGGHGFARNYGGFGRHFGRSYRYGWGYPNYGYYGYEAPVYEPVATVCASCEPVVAPPVAPVCTTCDSSYVAVDSGYAPYWGYGHYRNNYRSYGRSVGYGGHRGGRGR